MKTDFKLKASVRDTKENLNDLRKKGLIPAVLYGHDVENVNLAVNSKEFEDILKSAGETTMIELSFDKEKRSVLIHDVQRNYLKNMIDHVDFYQVRLDEKVQAEIELEFVGESLAVKNLGGVLVKSISKVEVEALPNDLPHTLKADLEKLVDFEAHLEVKDLEIPSGVKVLADSSLVIASVSPPREEEESTQPEASVEGVKVEGEEKRAEKEAEKEKA